jgi:basic membrane protein A and related proteins
MGMSNLREIDRRRFVLASGATIAAIGTVFTGKGAVAQDGETFKVAFVYVGPVGDLGWTYAHDQGRIEMVEALKANQVTVENKFSESVPEVQADAERVIRGYAQEGYNLIITTSFGYMEPTINVAKQFPDIEFIHISGYMTADNVSTAFGKIEEPRYVSGIIAGHMAEAGKLGYVAAFPIPEVIRGINAFTLGVRSVNPEATVQVVWTNTWYDPQKERQAAEALLDGGAEVIAQHQDTAGPQQAAEAVGKYGVGYNADMSELAPKAVLTCPIWHWGVYYEDAVRKIMDGSWESNQYWGGWKDGVVDLSPIADFVPEEVRTVAESEAEAFASGEKDIFTIFTGPLNDQNGEEKVAADVAMTDEEILNMNWFVAGVQGELPS